MIETPLNLDQARGIARRYFGPAKGSLWIWADQGQTLRWRDGATIAFQPELTAVLERLASHGLPPLGAVAMLLSACRDGWMDAGGGRFCLSSAGLLLKSSMNIPHGAQDHLAKNVQEVIEGLDAVNALPAELRRTKSAKAVLAEIVFESAARELTPEESMAALRMMENGFGGEDMEADDGVNAPWLYFSSEIAALRGGLNNLTAERVALRGRTGLDELVQPAEIELSASQRVRALLVELRDDPELAGLAALASNLMAAVHVPRTLHNREELPLGGVSDLSNRGALDRLLISELANDDMTLAIRVALNEAMYTRRESPPKSPPRRRAILIDSGIRTWGTPRVFAAAVALAMAATAEKNCELFVFRARRDGVTPVDLTTRGGLIAHLEAMETPPHPGSAMGPFFDAVGESKEIVCDSILVTHEDVLKDADFLRHCAKQEKLDLHIASVSREGGLRVIQMSRAGQRLISDARISLQQILPAAEAPEPVAPAAVVASDPKLPLALSARPFVFLLPQTVEPRLAGVSREHGLIAVTKDGRLMHWRQERRGGRQISDVVPRGRVHGIRFVESEPLAWVVIQSARGGNMVMLAVNLGTGRCATVRLKTTEAQPIAVTLRGDMLLLIYRSAVDAFNSRSGDFLAKLAIPPGMTWTHGRFFQGGGSFYAIAYDGLKLWLEKISSIAPSVLRLFDVAGQDGPAALLRDGRVEIPGQKTVLAASGNFSGIKRVMGISPQGYRIIVNSWEGAAPANFLLDLRNNEGWKRVHGDPAEALLAPVIYRSTRGGVTLRHNFQAIWATPQGELTLLSKKDHVVAIGLLPNREMGMADRGGWGREMPSRSDFPQRRDLRERAMSWVWRRGRMGARHISIRGLLHLKSSDPALPEISLVLSNGSMAGWSSDHERFGDDFFFDSPPTSDAAAFDAMIKAFVGRLR